ncbi:hypothetical protein [Novipirellula aureliae]|uniref:hypothetical protein n=1 Tax=Novipirellula aureliae TaxID=2527966 RepID=UPI0011B5EE36|nr:hypothetical protein [Novipirellula aureliae]
MTKSRNKQLQQHELTAQCDDVCCHTLHHCDPDGRLLGTWAETAGVYGLHVYCKVCGKLYGYRPRDERRTDEQWHKAYLKQKACNSADCTLESQHS